MTLRSRPLALLLALAVLATVSPLAAVTLNLEDFAAVYELQPSRQDAVDNGAAGHGGWEVQGAFFPNSFTDFGTFTAWDGWAVSTKADDVTPGFGNQYSPIAGGGASADGSPVVFGTFMVGFSPGTDDPAVIPPTVIELPESHRAPGAVMITNTTYAALSMRDGDAFAKKFGGPDGTDPDFFRLTIRGRGPEGDVTGTVAFYLADFRFADDREDYIVDAWQPVDLSPLGLNVATLEFTLWSSDTGAFGMNTPAYFALDRLVLNGTNGTELAPLELGFEEIPLAAERSWWPRAEQDTGLAGFTTPGFFLPYSATDFGGGFFSWSGFVTSNKTNTTWPGVNNQYSAFAGGGAANDGTAMPGEVYSVAYLSEGPVTITLDDHVGAPQFMHVTNTTYAALSMRDGDMFAKPFGGPDGTDPDFFLLTVEGFDADEQLTGAVEFYLADYRFADEALDYLVDEWRYVDLTPLGTDVRTLRFSLSSSDVGAFGMNTPAYFAFDNLTVLPDLFAGQATILSVDSWLDIPWLGPVNDLLYPWVYYPPLGFLYLPPLQDDGTVWFYSKRFTSWIATAPGFFPYFYDTAADDYFYLLREGDVTWIYDFANELWFRVGGG